MLRDLHERERVLADAVRSVSLRELALEDAVKLQQDARRQTRGMRDRLRSRELDRRLLTADARRELATARVALEAAELRVRAVQQRLNEVRSIVDAQGQGPRPEIEALRRTAELPAGAQRYASIADFIAEAPERAQGDPRQQDLVGDPIGDRWLLEEPGRPWEVAHWRAAWAAQPGQTGELYAVEHALRPHAARRVWRLGDATRDPSTVARLESLLTRQQERNSLALVASVVADPA